MSSGAREPPLTMKRLAPILLALASTLAARAEEEEIDPAVVAAFDDIAAAWRSGDARAVGAWIDKDSKVSLSLDRSGSYSKDQAISLLKDYFEANDVVSLKLEKDGMKGGSSPSATWDYVTTDADGRKVSARLFVSLVRRKDRWVLSRVAIYPARDR